ncbi:type IX secretion system membrane protein PorP/SprF [Brumimicrobium oceani]|uniref:Type IX secretion system membrane protein PorP/SprF n=1 Tax=Brumimicrobium oceani TaxID=2100725 RepID=A0A2U2XDA9_9FLAO|nr:type IX secretion system membrane protein PorP/SprF [Brumimicrobium oceani]PWH85772.1 hypothetical protein DIT68_06675 [Brumimicrobium oceani]
MSVPNFENIDRWLFEYTEGNLSADQEAQLLDFLELHPELMPELKAWKSAKVAAPVHEAIATQHLIKATPLLLRPYSLVSLVFISLLLTWFGIEMIPETPLYSKAHIDTGIIDAGNEESDEFDQFLSMSEQRTTHKKDDLIKTERAKLENSLTTQESNQNKVHKAKTIKASPIKVSNSGVDAEIQKLKEEALQNELFSKLTMNENWEDSEQDFAFQTGHRNIQSGDLNKISDYLNGKDQDEIQTTVQENLANQRNNNSSSTSASQSTLAKSIKNTFRKIKRMADYPVALQKTKNPYFHAPMMTGYKANFAMVGTAPGNRIEATSRLHWMNESNSQLMNSLSWDGYAHAIRGGLGVDINYNNYQNNDLNNFSAALTYSPKLAISKKISFEPALRFKMGVINLDMAASSIGKTVELDRENIIPLFEGQQQVNGQQLWYRDIGLGFMINTDWFYIGFNADNIGRHNNNFYSADLSKEYKSDLHCTAVFGTEYASKTKELRLSGYGLYQKYGALEEFWLGSNFQYEWFQIGAAASSNLDLAASLGAVFKGLSFHYNIDYTKSRLLNKQVLSHQVTMRILLKPSRHVAKFLKI